MPDSNVRRLEVQRTPLPKVVSYFIGIKTAKMSLKKIRNF